MISFINWAMWSTGKKLYFVLHFSVLFSLALFLVSLKALHADEAENANGECGVSLRKQLSVSVVMVMPSLPHPS